MRVLMLTWEYPPYIVGGLGTHAGALAPALARLGIDLHVVTPLQTESPEEESAGNLTIHRVPIEHISVVYSGFFEQVLRANLELLTFSSALRQRLGGFDLIHNHDWLTSFAARELKHSLHLPLVATIHATERGRGRGGLGSEAARQVDAAEYQLTYDAWRVICCTNYMVQEIREFFQAPPDKLDVIPNGIDARQFAYLDGVDLSEFRSRYVRPGERIVLYVGRIVYEKGAEVLVRAVPKVLADAPEAKFIFAGRGPELDRLQRLVEEMSLAHSVRFLGFIDDETRDKLYVTADCAVFPSLYEPFGIVALEAMAARTPVVVSDVGGLREVVQHGETGITVYPDNPESCAWGIVHTLKHPEWARQRVENAHRTLLERFSWDKIAAQTAEVYNQVVAERAQTGW
jgi:glycogen synthase